VNPPTVDDSKTPAVVGTKKAEAAPLKKKTTVKLKSKRHHRRMRATH
jgi:hypothetical protein